MARNGERDDIEQIIAQLMQAPDKEFYPGFFDEVRQVKEQLAARATRRKRPRPGGAYEARADLSLKAHLIQHWRRRQSGMAEKLE